MKTDFMNKIRQEALNLIGQLSDEQLSVLLPLIISIRNNQDRVFSNETSQAYQDWVSAENNIYDEIFADDLAAR